MWWCRVSGLDLGSGLPSAAALTLSPAKTNKSPETRQGADGPEQWNLPVVHQYIGLPEVVGRDPDVFDIVVLRHVPPHVAVRPLLMSGHSSDLGQNTEQDIWKFCLGIIWSIDVSEGFKCSIIRKVYRDGDVFWNLHWHCLTHCPVSGGLVLLFGSCRIKLHSKVSRCFLKIVTIKEVDWVGV